MLERTWFLTWTTYGTWLPGDRRGHVSNVRGQDGDTIRRNQPGDDVSSHNPALENSAHQLLKCDPIYLVLQHAEVLAKEILRTVDHRQWDLAGYAIMAQHVHVLLTVNDDPDPEKLLGEFKSYGSRILNRQFGRPRSDTWWTVSGSKRKVRDESEFIEKVQYTHDQPYSLVVWINPKYEMYLRKKDSDGESKNGEPGPPGPGCSHPRGD